MKIKVKVSKLQSFGRFENASVGIEMGDNVSREKRAELREELYKEAKKFVQEKVQDMKSSALQPTRQERFEDGT